MAVWIEETGKTWIDHVPKFKFLLETDRRAPYPLSFEAPERLFAELPAHRVKNRQDRLVAPNTVASGVIEDVRGQSDEHVFVYRGKPVRKMNGSAWKKARVQAGLPGARP
jgi:hypothetical protein